MRALIVLAWLATAGLGTTRLAQAENLEPGIWLEMAVLACQRGEPVEMERLLKGLEERFTPPDSIARYVSTLRESGCKRNDSPPTTTLQQDPLDEGSAPKEARGIRPLGRLALGLGATTNANSGPSVEVLTLSGLQDAQLVLDESFRPEPDAFLNLTAELEIPLPALQRQGLTLGVSASGRWLRTQKDFQELLWGGWFRGQWQITPEFTLGSGLSLASSRLGQRPYADHAQWSGQLQWGKQQQWRADVSHHQVRYAQREAFDAAVSQVGLAREIDLPGWTRSQVRLALLSDQGQVDRPGGDRRGWALQWSADRPGPRASLFSVRVHLERSLSRDAYALGLIEERRDHKVSRLEVAWLLPAGPRQFWRTTLMHRLERDDIPLLGLRETSLGVELNRLF